MNQYVVITQRDGVTTKEDGKSVTPIEQIQTRFVANDFHEVYERVMETLNDDELITIHQEHVGIHFIKAKHD